MPHDVVERLRLGMMLTVMSGSMNSNITSVFSDVPSYKDGLGHISFCADDKLVEDLNAEGHIDHHIREAIRLGVDPIKAYRMATLNAASYYRLDHLIGSITPAKLADLLILDSLEEVRLVPDIRLFLFFADLAKPYSSHCQWRIGGSRQSGLVQKLRSNPRFHSQEYSH